jgi:general nucleoside transport system ATP-binding protein
MDYVIEMENITKEFPGILANDNISINLKRGEILALLGENGAGKSTLMSILFGLYIPEKGTIKVNGKKVSITNPNHAGELGIGMVHQHFKLVHNFTVTENIILGMEPKGFYLNLGDARKKILELSEKYNLNVDPDSKIEDVSVGMQQRVEILKMLYRNAEILIFDEPTAVLTPQEIGDLMNIMKLLVKEGKSVVLITHKLKEIKSVANRCTVIRRGRVIDTVNVNETSPQEMAEKMVGRKISFNVEKQPANPGEIVLELKNLNVESRIIKKALSVKNFSIYVRRGEILGIAGVDGNGQTELIEAITGLRDIDSGEVILKGIDISRNLIRDRIFSGISHIPEDRHKHGLVLDYSLEDNLVLERISTPEFSNNGFLNREKIRNHANNVIESFDVRSGEGPITKTRSMSGGNQQKAIVGREIYQDPDLLIAVQPTRGLDVGSIEYIHKRLIEQRDKGKAVLLVSLELDEIMDLSDRIGVINSGELIGIVDADKTDENKLGLMMAGVTEHD